MATEWWDEFFTGLGAEFVKLSRSVEQTRKDVDLIEGVLGLAPGSRVLDVACGSGRHSLELARRGHWVKGLDLSPGLVAHAREAASLEALVAEFQVADMRQIPWKGEFDAAISFWTSVGYFGLDGDLDTFSGVHDALVPGGRFLVDCMSVETVLPDFLEEDSYDLGDLHVHEGRRYDHRTGRLDLEFTLSKGGRTEVKRASVHLYSYRELTDMLAISGFGDFEAYGGDADETFRLGARRLCLTARKPE